MQATPRIFAPCERVELLHNLRGKPRYFSSEMHAVSFLPKLNYAIELILVKNHFTLQSSVFTTLIHLGLQLILSFTAKLSVFG